MAQPWKIIDRIETDEGALELRQRGERDFLIMIGNQVLMNSLANRSEVELGRLGCRGLQERERPRVLVGGLGMGCTLRGCSTVCPLRPALWWRNSTRWCWNGAGDRWRS